MAWALITGASSGLGIEFARLAAADGHDLVISARSTDRLDTLAAELPTQTVVIPADLSQPGAADRLWESANDGRRIEILVNNAGLGIHGNLGRAPDLERGTLSVNVVAATELMQRALADFRDHGTRGRILNVASLAAFMPAPTMGLYHASKSYLLSLSEAVHHEAKAAGITVTALCPGPTRTGFFDAAGLGNSGVARLMPLQSAPQVARAGWRGMMAGKRTVIPGLATKALAVSTRVAPRGVMARVNKRFWNS